MQRLEAFRVLHGTGDCVSMSHIIIDEPYYYILYVFTDLYPLCFPLFSPVGSVASNTGSTACIPCEPGTAVTMMNTPQAFCQPCAPGMFAVSSNSQQVYMHDKSSV